MRRPAALQGTKGVAEMFARWPPAFNTRSPNARINPTFESFAAMDRLYTLKLSDRWT